MCHLHRPVSSTKPLQERPRNHPECSEGKTGVNLGFLNVNIFNEIRQDSFLPKRHSWIRIMSVWSQRSSLFFLFPVYIANFAYFWNYRKVEKVVINAHIDFTQIWQRLTPSQVVLVVKNLPANAGDVKDSRFNPSWVWKIPWRRKRLSTPVFLSGEFHGQWGLVGHSPWSHKESDMTEAT